MNRRNFIFSSAGTATTALVASTFASNMAFAAEKKTEAKPEAKSNKSLIEALSHCVQTGHACVAHCMQELANGNQEMAECNRTVHDMLATCESMLKLATYGSPLTKQMAAVCAKACETCAEACNKHSAHWAHGMHLACKECFESCKDCAKLCKAV